MAEKKVAKKKSREVLTDPMSRVRRAIKATEHDAMSIDGVKADVLDASAYANLVLAANKGFGKARDYLSRPRGGSGPTIPLKVPQATVVLNQPLPTPKPTTSSKLVKGLGNVVKKIPLVDALVMGYEGVDLATSEQARQAARDQAEEMYKRSDSLKGNIKNAAQGYLDPAGTVYAAGDALVDTAKTLGGLAYDKVFGPSYEEQKRKAYERIRRRQLEKMSPESRVAREKTLAQIEAQSASLPVVRSVLSAPPVSNSAAVRKMPKPKLERRRGR